MYLDVHETAQLIEFSQLAEELTPNDRALHTEDLEIYLEVIYEEASEPARVAFKARLEGTPQEDYPWSAVRTRRGAALPAVEATTAHRSPPALTLLMGKDSEFADWDEAGNYVPDYGSKEAEAYSELYDALLSWETTLLIGMMGPVGWTVAELALADEVAAAGEQALEDVEEVVKEKTESAKEALEDAAEKGAEGAWRIVKPVLIGTAAVGALVVVVTLAK